MIQNGKSGDMGEFAGLVGQYVPQDLLILDAGCGPGQMVAALASKKYNVIGVDYEPRIVNFTNTNFPELDVRLGNILALDFPTASIGCYISLGIVEHFVDGPQAALSEARRVLQANGIAMISVPYLNPARCNYLNCLASHDDKDSPLYFHQYYFSRDEFTKILHNSNFEVIGFFPYAVEAFLTRELPAFSKLWTSKLYPYRLKVLIRRILNNSPMWMRINYGHMALFICRAI